jgi:hypothetical protein
MLPSRKLADAMCEAVDLQMYYRGERCMIWDLYVKPFKMYNVLM